MFFKTKITTHKFFKYGFCLLLISGLIISAATGNGLGLDKFTNFLDNKSAAAAAPNTGDIIIGTVDTGSAIEVSVCIKATDGPIHITNVSNWLGYDTAALTPSPTILEKGVYGNGNNGYANMKWEQVLPLPVAPSTASKWTLRMDFVGDPLVAGSNGIAMQSTAPELFGKVKFDKIVGGTGSQAVSLIPNKNLYFSTEFPTTKVVQQVINTTSDCRNSQCPANTTSPNGYITPTACTSTCAPGTFYQAAGSTCQPCPAGSTCNGSPTSVTCPANTYCVPNSITPTACPSNTTSPAGTTSLAGCTSTCVAGTFLNTAGYTCDTCPAGFSCVANITTPVQCPVNTYCVSGSITPTACPSNTSSPAGSTSASACSSTCAAGTYFVTGTCTPCPAGSTCAGGVATPVSCAAGTYCPTGSSVSLACTAGNFCPIGSGAQTQCPANSYCGAGVGSASACPSNTSSPAGSTSASACISTCAAGSFLNVVGFSCDTCPAGFSCGANITTPVQCPVNTYCVAGSSTPTPCPVNTAGPAGATNLGACISTIAPVLNIKVNLAGPFENSIDAMTNSVRLANLLPNAQPYTIAPFSYNGSETLPASNIKTDICDWVLIEVRNASDVLVLKKAAMIKTNGEVIDAANATNGNNTVGLSISPITVSGNFKIIVRHRNHLAIATNTNIPLTMGATTLLDFTSNVNVKAANQIQVGTVGAGNTGAPIFGLRRGDANQDTSIDASDRSAISAAPEFDGAYDLRDLNLDGTVDAFDRSIAQNTPEATEVI